MTAAAAVWEETACRLAGLPSCLDFDAESAEEGDPYLGSLLAVAENAVAGGSAVVEKLVVVAAAAVAAAVAVASAVSAA